MVRWPTASGGAASFSSPSRCSARPSAGCAFATSIEQLWLWRGLQGMTAGAGMGRYPAPSSAISSTAPRRNA
jgi:MFS family permease